MESHVQLAFKTGIGSKQAIWVQAKLLDQKAYKRNKRAYKMNHLRKNIDWAYILPFVQELKAS